jgi:hypothetical protein
MAAPYLLDTTVLLHWTRDSRQARVIDANYQLSSSTLRPLICEVSLGEMLAFSYGRKWGAQKLKRLATSNATWSSWTSRITASGKRTRNSRLSRSRQVGPYSMERTIFGLGQQQKQLGPTS